MLHVLYELGKSDHQFRFRFKGTYLRDAYTFEVKDYLERSVLHSGNCDFYFEPWKVKLFSQNYTGDNLRIQHAI